MKYDTTHYGSTGGAKKSREAAALWRVVAKMRAAKGDSAGATRAKRNAQTHTDAAALSTPATRTALAARLGCDVRI